MLKKRIIFVLLLIQPFMVALGFGQVDGGKERLDRLFDELKSAGSQEEAVGVENQIWRLWFQSGNEEIDGLMAKAVERRNTYDFNGAIEYLNKIIELDPNYPEVWNQRATVHFHQDKLEASLWDVARALELEPRHFGALAGRAIIRLKQGKPVIARRNIQDALQYHPFLKERSYFPDLAQWE